MYLYLGAKVSMTLLEDMCRPYRLWDSNIFRLSRTIVQAETMSVRKPHAFVSLMLLTRWASHNDSP